MVSPSFVVFPWYIIFIVIFHEYDDKNKYIYCKYDIFDLFTFSGKLYCFTMAAIIILFLIV